MSRPCASLRGCCWRRRGLRHVDLLALLQRVGRIDDDLVAHRKTAQNLQRGAVIAADVERAQLDLVVRADDGDLRALRRGRAWR